MVRTLRLADLDEIRVAGVNWRPVRRALGITAFGVNAYTAGAGEQLIEEHDELGGGAAGHEELYVVLVGEARFTVDGEEIEAPAGTLVFVPEPGSRRAATALAPGTTVLVAGGDPATITPSAWEHTFAAQPLIDAGDPAGAYAQAAAGLRDHPDSASLHYNLACFASLAGDTEHALAHLRRAFAGDPRTREWAQTDTDLDPIRSHPDYPA
jgi:hypothetical protein